MINGERLIMVKRLLALMLVLLSCTAVQAKIPFQLGSVDMAKVLFYYDEVKILRIEISNREARYQTELNQQEKEIDELKQKLASSKVAESDKQELEKEFSRKMFNLQRKFEEYKQKLDEQKEEELEKIRQKVYREIELLAKIKKLDMVLDQRQLYFGEATDLTEELIERLNRKTGK
jgi:Skp family chaperone for outer membrane proteins